MESRVRQSKYSGIFAGLLCFTVCCGLKAQEYDYEQLKKKYGDENAVFLKREDHATVKISDGELKIFSDQSEDMLMLSEKANIYGEKAIYYSYFNDISDIEANTLVPQKGKFKSVKVRNIVEKNDISEGNFYDDSKSKNFVYSDIQPGARTVLSYREETKEPRFFGSFYFSSYVPTAQAEFSVTFPKEVTLSYKLFGADEKTVHFTQTENRNTITYTWKATDVRKYQLEEESPNIRYYEPHIIVRIDKYTSDGKTKNILAGPEGLNSWYYSMVKDINKVPNTALAHVVDSLTANQKTDMDKVKQIFYWVQDNINYVAFENGLGGFVPREASAICDKRYGDCKDMASIIVYMLGLAHIQAYHTMIGTRDIPYSYADVPMPLSCNHMIATYIADGKYYFLDGTGKYAPVGLHTSMIQGKEALISKSETTFEIVKVPEIPASTNQILDSVEVVLKDKEVRGTGYVQATGYLKIGLTHNMQNKTADENAKFLKRYLLKGNNRFQIDSSSYDNLTDREKPLHVHYAFNVADYVTRNGDEAYVNMNMDKTLQNELIDTDKRKTERMFNYKYIQRYTTTLQVPDGYTSTYLPENTSCSDPRFGFEITYRQVKNKIYQSKTITINTLMLEPGDFAAWDKMIKQLNKAYNESIILKKLPN
jgi:transglutaminase-like putative cysteine protease